MNIFVRRSERDAGVRGPLPSLSSHGPWSARARPGRLSYLAFRTVTHEGSWLPRAVEGEIPRDLCGTLYRNGPGQKETFGVPLGHMFDGDAYLTALRFENGRMSGLSRFLETRERKHEAACGRMRYHEFGTRCPSRALGGKKPPNINVFPMAGGHYAFSEAAPPVPFDPDTLACDDASDFGRNWPARTTFTAHPKRDPVTGDVFAYGVKVGLPSELLLARLPAGRDAFEIVARLRIGGFYPVHDFMITRSYVVFALPPLRVNIWGMLRNRTCVAENLLGEGGKPMRIIVVRKDGSAPPITLESYPANMIFHHGNAVESEDGATIRLISMETDAAAVFKLVDGWGHAAELKHSFSQMTEFLIDLNARTVSRTALTEGAPIEFPAIDPRTLGRTMGAIYALRIFDRPDDPLAFDGLTLWDGGRSRDVRARPGQMFGEPVSLLDAAGKSWIAHLGYDADGDESFLDIRDPNDLHLAARAWFGLRIPLGFHGCYIPDGDESVAMRH